MALTAPMLKRIQKKLHISIVKKHSFVVLSIRTNSSDRDTIGYTRIANAKKQFFKVLHTRFYHMEERTWVRLACKRRPLVSFFDFRVNCFLIERPALQWMTGLEWTVPSYPMAIEKHKKSAISSLPDWVTFFSTGNKHTLFGLLDCNNQVIEIWPGSSLRDALINQ